MIDEASDLRNVSDLCAQEGIELHGDVGQPYCCGERMKVMGWLVGPDYAECLQCGKAIGNAASPHISGCFRSDDWLKERGDKTWYCIAKGRDA